MSVPRIGSNLPNEYFKPTIYSKKINLKFYRETFLDQITNTNWQGEIKSMGNKVVIRVRPTVIVQRYSVNSTLSYQELQDEKLELNIDKAYSAQWKIDDVDEAQNDINVMNEATLDAANQMRIAIEGDVLSASYSDATNTLSSTALDPTNVIPWITAARTKLNKQNIPRQNRWLMVPPDVSDVLMRSDLKNAALMGDDQSVLRKDMIGRFAGFNIYESNNLAVSGGTWHCMAGHKEAITFASQVTRTETLRLQDTYGTAFRSLHVYGFKTVLPGALVYMPATIA